jgi:hypothetical protein
MKLNSNTIILEQDDLSSLLSITESIAKKNEVFNVGNANITLDPNQGEIAFKTIIFEN